MAEGNNSDFACDYNEGCGVKFKFAFEDKNLVAVS